MITLIVDSNLEVLPDFNSDEHKFMRNAIRHNRDGMSVEQAVEALAYLWNTKQEYKKAIWKAECEERKAADRLPRQQDRDDHGEQVIDELCPPDSLESSLQKKIKKLLT